MQIFVAAALMEYYTSKDKNIAFKIFELGLKRYGDDPNYVLAYIDHLSHLSGKDHQFHEFCIQSTVTFYLCVCVFLKNVCR